jgi:hypothetical protein
MEAFAQWGVYGIFVLPHHFQAGTEWKKHACSAVSVVNGSLFETKKKCAKVR